MAESIPTIGVLGIEGSYTHTAGEWFSGQMGIIGGAEIVELPTFGEIVGAVEAGEIDCGALPVKNAINGHLKAPLQVIADANVYATDEAYQPIGHRLLTTLGTNNLEDVEIVLSKAEAFDQCSKYLDENLPDAKRVSVGDTASAALEVARGGDGKVAAIASGRAADIYGLKIFNDGSVADNPHNETRFWLVQQELQAPVGSKPNRTAMILDDEDHTGSLLETLTVFANEGVDLFDIQSIRTSEGHEDNPWAASLKFYIEARASMSEAGMQKAWDKLQEIHGEDATHMLGSFTLGKTMKA